MLLSRCFWCFALVTIPPAFPCWSTLAMLEVKCHCDLPRLVTANAALIQLERSAAGSYCIVCLFDSGGRGQVM